MNNNATIDQSSSSAKAGRILRRRWQKAAGLNRWFQVIRIFDTASGAWLTDRDILWYVRACVRQKNFSSLKRACSLAAERSVRPQIKNAIARTMNLNGLSFESYEAIEPVIRSEQREPVAASVVHDATPALNECEPSSALQMISIEEIASSRRSSRNVAKRIRSTFSISGSEHVPQEIFNLFKTMDRQFQKIAHRPELTKVYEFSNVYTNRFGQVWDESGRLFKGSGHLGHPRLQSPSNIPHIKEAISLATGTKGFFHWYVERFPALVWSLRNGVPCLPILFGDHHATFQDESLALYFGAMPAITRVGEAIRVDRLFVCEGSIRQLAARNLNSFLYDPLVAAAQKKAANLVLADRIYISRKKALRRKIENESELEHHLAALGFAIICLEDFSVADQVNLFQNAKLVVAPHGAGLSHIVSARPGLKIFEIVTTDISWTLRIGQWSLRFLFARLSRMMGHNHHIWLQHVNPVSHHWRISMDQMLPELHRFAQPSNS